MSVHGYLGWLWIVAALALVVWSGASLITYLGSTADRTRVRLLTTLVLITMALVIADIARFRWQVTVLGIPPNSDAIGVAVYRTLWAVLLWVTTYHLYWRRFRGWCGRRWSR